MVSRLWTLLCMGMVTVAMTAVMSACSDSDNLGFSNPLGDKVFGLWYADYKEAGTYGVDNKAYGRVVEAVKFNPDGSGMWWKIMFSADNASEPLFLDGGRYSGTFDYVTFSDGSISAKRRAATDNYTYSGPTSLAFRFQDGAITTENGGAKQTLKPAPKDYDNLLLAMENSLHGAEADNYNINDKDFTADTWHQQDAIYIYDGVSADIKDDNGNEGYAKVNLPWFNGTVVSNLPMDFCNDVTPENGWELVLNSCGMRSMPNGNFFALYNKYLGILRFFYYLPQGFSAGNDHLWQTTFTQGLAERYDLRYGIPLDKTVTAKETFGMTADGTSWADYVTPYVSTLSNDGFITPNAGWWAFDADLSLYRTEAIDPSAEKIRLQMRSWDNSHVSLQSLFTAESNGDIIDFAKVSANMSRGLFGKISDVVNPVASLGKSVYALSTGDVMSGISNGVMFGKYSVSSIKSLLAGKDSPPLGSISISTHGSVSTDGSISSSQPTVGIVSPTYLLSSDFKNDNTIGQGIWNIKSTPKIYTINSANTIHNFIPEDKKFGDEDKWLVDAANWTFFDPSSVEVVLNPNLFPEDQIEWMQVDAVAGLPTSVKASDIDKYRPALGMEALASKNVVDDQIRWTKDLGNESTDYVFNFVGAENSPAQTLDLAYPKSIDSGKTGYKVYWVCKIELNWGEVETHKGTTEQQLITFGAGSGDDYIIEPQMVFWRDGLDNAYFAAAPDKNGVYNLYNSQIADQNRADNRNGKNSYDSGYIKDKKFDPNAIYNGDCGYIVGYDPDGKNGYPTRDTPTIDIRLIPIHFPAAEINVTLTVKMKNLANPLVYNRTYLPEYEYLKVMGDEQAVLGIIDRINAKQNLSPKTAGHTQSYDFQAARINKCFKLLTGFSR